MKIKIILRYITLATFFFSFLAGMPKFVGSQIPNQEWNPCPLQRKHRVLTTGPPGKSNKIHVWQPSLLAKLWGNRDFHVLMGRAKWYNLDHILCQNSECIYCLFSLIFVYLAEVGLHWDMQNLLCHVGCNSLTKDQTWAPCIGSAECWPLDHQGSPRILFLNSECMYCFSRF